jgi:crotonobetainyl-CoA:carnitine CoA-transferase CaiB-like acyl-CoA transferase
MNDQSLANDDRFREAHQRHSNQRELDGIIAEWTRSQDATAIFECLSAVGVPCGPVLTHVDLYHDAHLRERRFFEPVKHADAGSWEMDGPAYGFARRPTSIRRNAPSFGEHNDYVLRELLGMSREEVEALRAEGIIAGEPNMAAHQ